MISVCMATYNGVKYIKEQINSILVQLSQDDELVISDDGSIDGTLSIIESYSDQRIKLLRNNNRKGVLGNFENALSNSKGDYIFLCDQDDVWIDGKVEKCLQELKQYDMVVTDCIVTDMNLRTIKESFFEFRGSGNGFIKNLIKNTYLGACIAFRRTLLDVALPFPEKLSVNHDEWIGSLAEITGKVKFDGFKGIYYRRHAESTSSTADTSKFSIIRKLKNRISLFSLVMKRFFSEKFGNN